MYEGHYDLAIRSPDAHSYDKWRTVKSAVPSDTFDVEIRLDPRATSGSLLFTLWSPSGAPMSTVDLSLFLGSRVARRRLAAISEEGRFAFRNLNEGVYDLVIGHAELGRRVLRGIDVSGDRLTDLGNLHFEAPGWLELHCVSGSGGGVIEPVVSMQGLATKFVALDKERNGSFRSGPLQPGDWSVQAWGLNAGLEHRVFTIASGVQHSHSISLQPGVLTFFKFACMREDLAGSACELQVTRGGDGESFRFRLFWRADHVPAGWTAVRPFGAGDYSYRVLLAGEELASGSFPVGLESERTEVLGSIE